MSQINFHSIPKADRVVIYQELAAKTGMPPFATEKDWWVVQTLVIIFEMEIGRHLVFKGGTSLSKAWGVIDRFSEDVDLALDRSFLGFEGELSKGQRTKLRKKAGKYIAEVFCLTLEAGFKKKGLNDVKIEIVAPVSSDQDPRIIEIYYPNVIEHPGYIQPRVQVEIGCRSLKEPFSTQTFSSLVDEHYAGKEFTHGSISVPTVNPERTLLEKIFLLHEEFQRPSEKIRVDRLSRHLYDVYQLSKTDFSDKAIYDKTLYETIVLHRHAFTRVGGVDYNRHQPRCVNPIPPADFIDAWEKDYKTMQEQMIYGNSPSFEDMIIALKAFVIKINQVEWTWELEFPDQKTNGN